jgi:hypothetical protein
MARPSARSRFSPPRGEAVHPPPERTAAAVYFLLRSGVARAPRRPLNGITLCGGCPIALTDFEISAASRDVKRDIEHHRLILEARAARLLAESREWAPVDMTRPHELRETRRARQELLWDTAIAGGGVILNLSAQRQLNSAPRLQTRALQARAEIQRSTEAGELPWDVWPVPAEGLDLLVVQMFDDCCHIWLGKGERRIWFGRESEAAATYAAFMLELARHLEPHGADTLGSAKPPKSAG